jgi:hypothetical protein
VLTGCGLANYTLFLGEDRICGFRKFRLQSSSKQGLQTSESGLGRNARLQPRSDDGCKRVVLCWPVCNPRPNGACKRVILCLLVCKSRSNKTYKLVVFFALYPQLRTVLHHGELVHMFNK